MKILIDADGCPVVKKAAEIAAKHGTECIIVCDTCHVFDIAGVKTVTVDKAADSADFKVVNMAQRGDIVVTQDYGLAAMALSRLCTVLNQDGMEYTSDNIDALLLARSTAKKIRRGGGRLKGPSKRTAEQDKAFAAALEAKISAQL